MKCPKCGLIASEPTKACRRCGSVLALPASPSRTRRAGEEEVVSRDEPPPWRREVTRKVRAYGERKKALITPPGPLKESTQVPFPPAEVPPADEPVSVPPPDPEPEIRSEDIRSVPRPGLPHSPSLRVEMWTEDLEEGEAPPSEKATLPSRYVSRRAIALIIDSTIIIVLYCAMVLLSSWLAGFDPITFLRASWLTLGEVFLLVHCLYYLYFYKTSRQTPGQVFFGIELRDPTTSSIPVHKILIRWAAMVLLNVFNLIPLFSRDKPLLLDRLSGTRIRSLR